MAAMSMSPDPLGVPATREGSGTSWLPSATPMYARHWQRSGWELMLHGNVFAQYIAESGDRGMRQLGSVNWVMGMAHSELAGGKLGLHAMFSADPITVGKCGYPDILATGERCNDEPLHDQQHPHDVFMELTASYERALSRSIAFQLYGGPVGEPALGPVAYPHRVSAMPGPSAPIGHHWMDATHISFGVVSAGLFTNRWKLEGSIFNGREPDDERFNFDFAPLDSYSSRLWYLPNDHWALQVSAGHLVEAEPGRGAGAAALNIDRQTASATYHRPFAAGGIWATTAVWGRNVHDGHATNAFLLETNVNLAERNVFLARFESAQKTGEDLVLDARPDLNERVFNVHKLSFGYLRKLGHLAGFVPAIGIQENVSILPADLKAFYGTRTPAGIAVFVNLRAAPMADHAMGAMAAAPPPGVAPHNMGRPAAPANAPAGHENMRGMQHEAAPPAPAVRDSMPGMQHEAPHAAEPKPDVHAAMPGMAMPPSDTSLLELQRRLLADPVIRARVLADTTLTRLLHATSVAPHKPATKSVQTPTKKPATKPASKAAKRPVKKPVQKPAPKPAEKPAVHDMGKTKM